jgi:hypothetical protein
MDFDLLDPQIGHQKILIYWNHLGFDIIFSCQENLDFQGAKKVFYVVRFLRHLIDYIYRNSPKLRFCLNG